MKVIDIEKWNRKVPYQNFVNYTNPIFGLGTRLDVTKLYNYCKNGGRSFFTEFLYIASKSLNEIEEFRLRIYKGNVVSFDVVHPSFIVNDKNGAITTCKVNMNFDRQEFYQSARLASSQKQKADSDEKFNDNATNDLLYCSCVPWADACQANNPYDLKDIEGSTIPRLTWAKYVNENGRMKMFFNIEAHHALIDGEPICRAFNLIQKYLDQVE